jgi:carboxypeptidase Taq
MPEASTAYTALEPRFRRIGALDQAAGVLHWDMATMMPQGGAPARSEQLAALSVTCHELLTDPAVAELLAAAEAESESLDPWQRANLREMAREWRHGTALASDLVEALSKAGQRCEMIWRQARPAADFAAVRPSLEALLDLKREAAAAKAEAFGCAPYDALLDQYDPGLTAARIDRIFDPLADFLPGFLEQVLTKQARDPAPIALKGPFQPERQEALARKLMAIVGFDFDHGRLDRSAHPFCGGVPDDVRITTRYDEDDPLSALMAVLHETGHALYERGLPAEWRLQPVGHARGMATHEGQSLLIEMQVCRGAGFIAFAAPLIAEAFGGVGPAWQADNLTRLASRVAPGFIRVDADEVTYPAHIILRTRLERAMIAGDLRPADLPGAWNDAMKELLGLTPPDDRLGCLQDIHWYDGALGYFPTYTLGAMTAAQLFAAAKAAVPEIPDALGRGDFAPLLDWLGTQVHSKGSRPTGEELLIEATGKPLDPEVFKAHLTTRYLG